jgi:uncharacterized protein (DUF608 family)
MWCRKLGALRTPRHRPVGSCINPTRLKRGMCGWWSYITIHKSRGFGLIRLYFFWWPNVCFLHLFLLLFSVYIPMSSRVKFQNWSVMAPVAKRFRRLYAFEANMVIRFCAMISPLSYRMKRQKKQRDVHATCYSLAMENDVHNCSYDVHVFFFSSMYHPLISVT